MNAVQNVCYIHDKHSTILQSDRSINQFVAFDLYAYEKFSLRKKYT